MNPPSPPKKRSGPLRVILYARLSRSHEDSTSIERQLSDLREHARARRWRVVEECADEGVSATRARLNRPGLKRAREAIQEGRAEAVAVWKLDRLARNAADLGTLMDEGMEIVSLQDDLNTTTKTGRLQAEILMVVARMEAENTGARTAALRRANAHGGRWIGGPTPYGYQVVSAGEGRGSRLAIKEDEAAIVREAVKGVLDGRSTYNVATDLNKRGVPTKQGGRWNSTNVRRLVRSDFILGRVRWHGKPVRGADGLPEVFYPPIITPAESAAVRAATETRTKRTGAQRDGTRLLSGFIHCGTCGGPMRVQRRNPEEKSLYVCATAGRYGTSERGCQRGMVIQALGVERWFDMEFQELFGRRVVTQRVAYSKEADEIAELSEAIEDLTSQLGDAPEEDFKGLVENLSSLRARRIELEGVVQYGERRESLGVTVDAVWNDKADVSKRRILQAAEIEIVVGPGTKGVANPGARCELIVGNEHWE